MNQDLIFETRQHQSVVRASALHACLGVTTALRLWVMMHTAAGNALDGVDVFHDGTPGTACWSLEYAAQVARLEYATELAAELDQAASLVPSVRA